MDQVKLNSFWDRTRQQLAKEPIDVEISIADTKAHSYYPHRITYRSLDGVKVRAYLSSPRLDEEKGPRLPAIVTAPGYSGWGMSISLAECQRGYIILQVYPRGQGESAELWKVQPGAEKAWVNHGKHNPEGFYYQGAYADMMRGVDYLLTRHDVDPNRIGLHGTSQAGGIVLSVGGIDPRVKAVVSHVPFLCDFRHNVAYKSCPDLVGDPVFLNTFDYFDPVNLAPLLKAPTLVSSGGKDFTCPPDAIRAVWNRLPGIKALHHEPDLTHTTSVDFYNMGWEWFARYL